MVLKIFLALAYIIVDDGSLQQIKLSRESLLSALDVYQEKANQLLKWKM